MGEVEEGTSKVSAAFSDPVCGGVEAMVVAGSEVNYDKVEFIAFTQGFSIAVSSEADFLTYFTDVPCHHFFIVFALFGRDRGVVNVMLLSFLFFVFAEKLVESIAYSVQFRKLFFVVGGWFLLLSIECDLLMRCARASMGS